MSKEQEIKREVKKISKNIKKGDAIVLLCESHEIARYEFDEWSIDSKTPEDWITGCIVFEVKYANRDINKCKIKFEPAA